jgi:hypothetical protein
MADEILDYGVIAPKVRNLHTAIDNKLWRERHPRLDEVDGAGRLISSHFKVAVNLFQSVMFLCADSSADPMRRPEFGVAAQPLVRGLVESLFSIGFVFEDLHTNVHWYWTSGWYENKRLLEQWERRHGGDSEWTALLAEHRGLLERKRQELRLPPDDEEGSSNKPRPWPRPGEMRRSITCSEKGKVLAYVYDWYYGPLSCSTHLRAPGLGTDAALLLARDHLEDFENRLERFKSDQSMAALTLLLAIESELQHELTLGLASDLAFVWVIVGKYAWGADDLYKMRYQRLLGFGG